LNTGGKPFFPRRLDFRNANNRYHTRLFAVIPGNRLPSFFYHSIPGATSGTASEPAVGLATTFLTEKTGFNGHYRTPLGRFLLSLFIFYFFVPLCLT
jgi:hypothetical protein